MVILNFFVMDMKVDDFLDDVIAFLVFLLVVMVAMVGFLWYNDITFERIDEHIKPSIRSTPDTR